VDIDGDGDVDLDEQSLTRPSARLPSASQVAVGDMGSPSATSRSKSKTASTTKATRVRVHDQGDEVVHVHVAAGQRWWGRNKKGPLRVLM
jgi:hypothetical protein